MTKIAKRNFVKASKIVEVPIGMNRIRVDLHTHTGPSEERQALNWFLHRTSSYDVLLPQIVAQLFYIVKKAPLKRWTDAI